jgi:hypothetical protein
MKSRRIVWSAYEYFVGEATCSMTPSRMIVRSAIRPQLVVRDDHGRLRSPLDALDSPSGLAELDVEPAKRLVKKKQFGSHHRATATRCFAFRNVVQQTSSTGSGGACAPRRDPVCAERQDPRRNET